MTWVDNKQAKSNMPAIGETWAIEFRNFTREGRVTKLNKTTFRISTAYGTWTFYYPHLTAAHGYGHNLTATKTSFWPCD